MEDRQELFITPKTKVGELLNAYPELEPVLMDLAPAFKKLKNPILRKTVGKVATLQQAAALGNVSVTEIINTLRSEVGQELYDEAAMHSEINYKEPGWFEEDKIIIQLDATPIINSGKNPMQEILNHLDKTNPQDIFLLITPFVPAPIIELITKKGYAHFCRKKNEDEFHTFFNQGTLSN